MLSQRISSIFKKITYAALRAGRNPEEIKLIAVSKSQSIDKIIEAADLGLRIFGESRVQEAKDKIEKIKDFNIEWHMIGHLQTNKVKDAVRLFEVIHSLDSEKLAVSINKEAEKINKIQRVLIQIKLSQEESKYGIEEDEVEKLIEKCKNLNNIKIEGLMTIPPYFDNPNNVRPYFSKLRQIRDFLSNKYPFIKELSMGMSHDFEVAIEEGATMVRIGTALFGQRIK
ncbi:MAG: YggS family pyridoxal phosphate-dependent enzyme [Thermodesulfovibrio sp.]|uniref:YggS family pyridoxal phosphate-dependent enzyme n=1 Tax=Thermodesulfovibrio sp. 1176 TaxID=3043424 RepID=UPI002482D64F|nr:YggS family pyridoxal phosphate-dependent enzyme [Thermodesulfovibrio sp. 1176]MDI6714226.1 YggS family pyridoxal phosphate-dependent enzyme [Thermodesulfovibrio sp.]